MPRRMGRRDLCAMSRSRVTGVNRSTRSLDLPKVQPQLVRRAASTCPMCSLDSSDTQPRLIQRTASPFQTPIMHHRARCRPAASCASKTSHQPTWTPLCFSRRINTAHLSPKLPQSHSILISLPLPTTLSMPPPATRSKNKSAHPGAPDMTPSQLASVGLSRPAKPVKMTMAKEIAALKAELRAAQEAIYVS
jgi:hypothetical protein